MAFTRSQMPIYELVFSLSNLIKILGELSFFCIIVLARMNCKKKIVHKLRTRWRGSRPGCRDEQIHVFTFQIQIYIKHSNKSRTDERFPLAHPSRGEPAWIQSWAFSLLTAPRRSIPGKKTRGRLWPRHKQQRDAQTYPRPPTAGQRAGPVTRVAWTSRGRRHTASPLVRSPCDVSGGKFKLVPPTPTTTPPPPPSMNHTGFGPTRFPGTVHGLVVSVEERRQDGTRSVFFVDGVRCCRLCA